MCKKLNVTKNALIVKKDKLKLGAFLENGEYISLNQLFIALGFKKVIKHHEIKWISRAFPLKHKRINKQRVKVVSINEFWEWAEKNRDLIDFSRLEENTLGAEPKWVKKQRKIDYLSKSNYKKGQWTVAEDKYLMLLLSQYKYTYLDLSKMLNRPEGAIRRRICTLNCIERPIEDMSPRITQEELNKIKGLILSGANYMALKHELNRSEKKLRDKLRYIYGVENLDKIRKIIKEETL